MQLEENANEKEELKPHWKAGAVVLGLVVVIVAIMMARGRSTGGFTQGDASDPSQFGDVADESAAGTKMAPPDLTANNCEEPATKCANNCKVKPEEVGACDWQSVGGSTATPAEAVKTFAAALQKIQAQAEKGDEEVDQAYTFDQFIKFYKKTLSRSDRSTLQNIRATSMDPFQQKAVEILLKDD